MKITKKNFLKELLKEIPEFKPIHEEQKEYHDLGINILFGDLKRLTEKTTQENKQELVKRIAKFIVKCYNGDKGIKNAVFVSFFETMNKDSIESISKYLPKKIVTEIHEFLKEFDDATPARLTLNFA